MQNQKIAIIGDGGWGTALALVSHRIGHETTLLSFFPEYAETLKKEKENVKYLKGIPLPEDLSISTDIQATIQENEILIFAIPTQYIRPVIAKFEPSWFADKIIVSVAKGLEKGSLERPSEIITEILKPQNLVVLSGPSHAEEVARNMPTCVVAASENKEAMQKVQVALSDQRFRIYTSEDMIGVELGGALKNVIAIAGGACDGLNFGSNSMSALLTRGLYEMQQLAVKMGAKEETFSGLSGLGDLVTTCISEHGRNRYVGKLLGEGKTLEQIMESMEMVAEGVETAKSINELSEKYNVEMPIATEVYNILFNGKSALKAVEDLMTREPTAE